MVHRVSVGQKDPLSPDRDSHLELPLQLGTSFRRTLLRLGHVVHVHEVVRCPTKTDRWL